MSRQVPVVISPFIVAGLKMLLALQSEPATVSGVIRDGDAGRTIADAVVTLAELDITSITDSDGRYRIAAVSAGPHHLVIRRLGYAPRTLHVLVPSSGILEINVSLSPVSTPAHLPNVVVRRPIEIKGSESDDSLSIANKTLSVAAIRNNPMLTEPDVLQSLSGGEIAIQPESPSGVHIRGGASDQTAYTVDGIPVFSPYHSSGLYSAWNSEALSHVSVTSAMPSPGDPATLSGTVAATTRTPGRQVQLRSSVSNTNAGFTIDGPLGFDGVGFLASIRTGYPHITAPSNDPTYVRGKSGDELIKIELPAFGGRMKVLGYHNVNELGVAAESDAELPLGQVRRRNTFEWQSQSFGAEWTRVFSKTRLQILGWSSDGDAESIWLGRTSPLMMTNERQDKGVSVVAERKFTRSSIVSGARVEHVRTSYVIDFDSAGVAPFKLGGRETNATVFGQYSAAVGTHGQVRAATSVASAAGSIHASPGIELLWKHSGRLATSAGYSRVHQFAQSLRNPESVTGAVFPADLFASAGSPGVPVARSDLGVFATVYRPAPDARIVLQAWQRRFDNVVFIAPFDDEPYATRSFGTGSGSARGASIEGSVTSARLGIVGSYRLQRVRYSSGPLEFVPDHGATHLLEGGVIVFPSATSSVRLGATYSASRQTTAIGGPFEWEACNLRDHGCEFSGSPRSNGQPLGEQHLPSYLRVDLGARKHWHFDMAGRNATVELFGAVTNVLNRRNVLTYLRNSSTGAASPVEMRPFAPLVVGMEWRF